MATKPTLFVGSSVEGLHYAYAVQENLEHDAFVTVWNQSVFDLSATTLESLVAAVAASDFGAFVLSADDVATIRSQIHSVPRDNVIFELGIFVGALGKNRTFILTPRGSGAVKLPTDLLGVTAATFDSNRPDENFAAAVGTACNAIRRAFRAFGAASERRAGNVDVGAHEQVSGGASEADEANQPQQQRAREGSNSSSSRTTAHLQGTEAGEVRSENRAIVEASAPAKQAVRAALQTHPTYSVGLVSVPTGLLELGDSNGRTKIAVRRPFFLSRHLVTQRLYAKVMKANPSHFKGDDLPVEKVSWNDAVDFCNTLSKLDGLEPAYDRIGKVVNVDLRRNGYRLPTEAEWELACHGGNQGAADKSLDAVAWYVKNSNANTHPVGMKAPNGLGLFDMLGNLWEWCGDWYERRSPSAALLEDPTGAESGVERVLRGGSWNSVSKNVTASYRFRRDPSSRENDVGFRIARTDVLR